MTSTDTITEVELGSKDSSGGSRLLSKISRSPSSRSKHGAMPSLSSQTSDTVPELSSSGQISSHSKRNQPRPGFQRQASAPAAPVALNPLLVYDDAATRTYSDGTGQAAQYVNKTQVPPHLQTFKKPALPNKNAGMIPLNSDIYMTQPQLPAPYQGTASTNFIYQQLHDQSNKRIATLNYMRKSHEGKGFWFSTVQFTKTDISRMSSYTPNRLARRAVNYFLFGLSVPAVLDIYPPPHPSNSLQTNINLALDFLQSLNTLLSEFETYQQMHPADGSHVGSLSRARLPSMFKRSTTPNRPRKSSSAPASDYHSSISPPAIPDTPIHHGSQPSIDTTYSSQTFSSSASTLASPPSLPPSSSSSSNPPPAPLPPSFMNPAGFANSTAYPSPGPTDAPNATLLPSEGPYTHLLTPPLPFAPDFYTVFATVCDILIDTYQRLLQIVNSPAVCTVGVAEMFSRADARMRKVMVGAIVRDFEACSRDAAKRELNGIQKVVLGGLMGSG